VDAAELGLRWRGRNARIDLAVFTMDKDNVILRDSAGFNVSDGETRHRGVEYEFDWNPAEDWTISGSGTYARHEYRFTAAVEQGEQITSGDDIDTAPRQLHALRLRREARDIAAELEWLHVGDYWANAANTARYDGHDLMNLRLSWQPRPAWSLTARVINLFDAEFADRADFAFGSYRYFPGRDRSVFVELGWSSRGDISTSCLARKWRCPLRHAAAAA
jgi:outer membrane receptor protein involved in Fe transport